MKCIWAGGWHDLPRAAAMALSCGFAGAASLLLAELGPGDAILRPLAGVALAGLLILGLRFWPAALLGGLAAMLAAASNVDAVLMSSDLAAALFAVLILRLWAPIDLECTRLRDILRLTLASAAGAIGGGLSAAMIIHSSGGWSRVEALDLAVHWTIGALLGMLALSPLLLVWTRREAWKLATQDWIGLAVLTLATAVVLYLVMVDGRYHSLRTWYVYPMLIWLAIAYQVRGAAFGIVIVVGMAIWGLVLDRGPFVSLSDDPFMQAVFAQQFTAITAFVALVLAATSDERRGVALAHRNRRRLQQSEDHYRHFVALSPQITWTADRHGKFLEVSPRWLEWTGFELDESDPKAWIEIIHPDDREAGLAAWRESRRSGKPLDHEVRFRMADGSWRWLRTRAYARCNRFGRIIRWYGQTEDVHDRRLAEMGLIVERDRAAHLARHDPLTGLANRTLFRESLDKAVAQAGFSSGRVALVLVDLDRFKQINDSHGHLVGDAVLRIVAERMRACIRNADTAARIGGDEFALVLPELTADLAPVALAERIRDALIGPVTSDQTTVDIHASVGVAIYPDDAETVSLLMRCADLALYQAKSCREAGVFAYHKSLSEEAQHRDRIDAELHRATDAGELTLEYQPQVEIASDQIIAVEALVRWKHPSGRLLPPSDFIPIAETNGVIRAIDSWVVGEACRQQALWRAAGHRLTMGINISPVEVGRDGFFDVLQKAFADFELDGSAIELEITENLLVDPDLSPVRDFLDACAQCGVRLAVDDFGTGYSSLSYLSRLPAAKLKIDRSFIAQIGNRDDEVVIAAIADLGRKLGKRVVAEGVETQHQFDFLSEVQCDDVQGYHVARPAAADVIEQRLEGQAP